MRYFGIETDFTYTIESEDIDNKTKIDLYVLVKGEFDEDSLDYGFTIHRDVGKEDITSIVELLNPEVYEDIENDAKFEVEKYTEQALCEWEVNA